MVIEEMNEIYVIHCKGTDFYKIGITKTGDVNSRLSSLQTGCPYELEITKSENSVKYPEDKEAKIHSFFSERKVRGEWFRFSKDEIWKLLFEIDLQCSDNPNKVIAWEFEFEERYKYVKKRLAEEAMKKFPNLTKEEVIEVIT
jgi:predicted GIY-YIG superfamily endonuclease